MGKHPDTLQSMCNLGSLYNLQGEYTVAELLLTEALAAYRKQLGDDHEDTLNTEGNFGVVRIRQGGAAHAERFPKGSLVDIVVEVAISAFSRMPDVEATLIDIREAVGAEVLV